ncbi:uncharacterized protein LOC144577008 isoform X2 [Callithrix jacchus]
MVRHRGARSSLAEDASGRTREVAAARAQRSETSAAIASHRLPSRPRSEGAGRDLEQPGAGRCLAPSMAERPGRGRGLGQRTPGAPVRKAGPGAAGHGAGLGARLGAQDAWSSRTGGGACSGRWGAESNPEDAWNSRVGRGAWTRGSLEAAGRRAGPGPEDVCSSGLGGGVWSRRRPEQTGTGRGLGREDAGSVRAGGGAWVDHRLPGLPELGGTALKVWSLRGLERQGSMCWQGCVTPQRITRTTDPELLLLTWTCIPPLHSSLTPRSSGQEQRKN